MDGVGERGEVGYEEEDVERGDNEVGEENIWEEIMGVIEGGESLVGIEMEGGRK